MAFVEIYHSYQLLDLMCMDDSGGVLTYY